MKRLVYRLALGGGSRVARAGLMFIPLARSLSGAFVVNFSWITPSKFVLYRVQEDIVPSLLLVLISL